MTGPDALDERILRALATDGRVATLAPGRRVGLSASAALRRVEALERRGAIRGYRAVPERAAVGRGTVVHVAVAPPDLAA